MPTSSRPIGEFAKLKMRRGVSGWTALTQRGDDDRRKHKPNEQTTAPKKTLAPPDRNT